MYRWVRDVVATSGGSAATKGFLEATILEGSTSTAIKCVVAVVWWELQTSPWWFVIRRVHDGLSGEYTVGLIRSRDYILRLGDSFWAFLLYSVAPSSEKRTARIAKIAEIL